MEKKRDWIVAGAIIRDGNKYLFTQERKPEYYGQWSTPGGRVEEGDTPKETIIREVKEETNYDIKIVRKLGVFNPDGLFAHMFEAELVGGELKFPENELMDVRWLTAEEILGGKYQIRGGDTIPNLIQEIESRS